MAVVVGVENMAATHVHGTRVDARVHVVGRVRCDPNIFGGVDGRGAECVLGLVQRRKTGGLNGKWREGEGNGTHGSPLRARVRCSWGYGTRLAGAVPP